MDFTGQTLKNLTDFLHFDLDAFLNGKQLVVAGVRNWSDYTTKEHLGTKVDCIIAEDKTQYKPKNGIVKTNRFAALTFKVSKDVNPATNSVILPVNPVGKVYGSYYNQLSITCDDIKIMDIEP